MGNKVFKDIPEKRFSKIIIPTPWQRSNPSLSGFEAIAGRRSDARLRGLMFTWIWTDLGFDWAYIQKEWGKDRQWVKYIPYFWRNGEEFYSWETGFIQCANKKNPSMNQDDLQRQGEQLRSNLNLGAIQAGLTGVVTKGPMLWRWGATTLSKMDDIGGAVDMIKCGMSSEEYHKECAKVIFGWATKGSKMSISE